jgi:cation diffusion facilitator family transporter
VRQSIRSQAVLKAIALTFVANLLVASTKIVVGLATGLLSVTASGFESLLDTLNNVFGFAALKLSQRAPDHDHPYGHRKFETFAAVMVAFLMFLAGTHIFLAAVRRLHEGFSPETSTWAYGVMILSIVVNIFVITYENRVGRKFKSEFLMADAAHTSTDLFSSLLVIMAIGFVAAGLAWADLAAAVAVVLIIAWVGFRLIRDAFLILTDSAQLDPKEILRCATSVAGVLEVHNIRSRGTPDAVLVDLHIKVEPTMSVQEGHTLSHAVKDCIIHELPEVVDVVVHLEPATDSTGPSGAE